MRTSKIVPDLIEAALDRSISGDIQSADIEICASGFDNLVIYDELDELESFKKALALVGAVSCEAVIAELIEWLKSDPAKTSPEVLDTNSERANEFWKAYDRASCDENPQELAAAYESKANK